MVNEEIAFEAMAFISLIVLVACCVDDELMKKKRILLYRRESSVVPLDEIHVSSLRLNHMYGRVVASWPIQLHSVKFVNTRIYPSTSLFSSATNKYLFIFIIVSFYTIHIATCQKLIGSYNVNTSNEIK